MKEAMVAVNRVAIVALALGLGCATTAHQAAKSPPPPASPPPRVRLAWLPFDASASSGLTAAVNTQLEQVKIAGVTETFQVPVSMEMAQLAIECIEKTARCYAAVGRSVGADRLLWADLDRRAHGDLTLRVALFDVDRGAVVHEAAQSYPSAKAAQADVDALIARAQSGEGQALAGKAP
jgi:muconolactone delta-isomerase